MARGVNGHASSCPALCRASTSFFFHGAANRTWMAGHRRAEATPSFGALCPAMTFFWLEPLAFGRGVIPAGIIGHGAFVVAICSVVGAGEIFHCVSKICVGIAQPFG